MRILLTGCLALLLSSAYAADVESHTLSLQQYREQLAQIRDTLNKNEFAGASSRAARVMKAKIRSGGELLEPDRSTLSPISKGDGLQTQSAVARLNVLIEALPQDNAQPATTVAASDRALLENLRAEQAYSAPVQGGEVLQPEDQFGLLNKFGNVLKTVLGWIGNAVKGIFNWLMKLFVVGTKAQPSEYIGPFTLMALLCIAGLCALLVWDIVKKNRAARLPQPVQSAPVKAEARDADPLSRNANEWEVYARKLAASGQYRESIRAWYHAVLVTLYRTGTLHYRKGRTNWEYCYALSPSVTWRPEFMELTRRFEFEWYGKHSSSAEDLETCAQQAQSILHSVEQPGGRR